MNRSSDDLLKEIETNKLKTLNDYENYRKKHAESMTPYIKLDRALMAKIKEKNLKKSAVIKQAGIAASYGYQILDGKKPNPNRDKVIRMCIGIGLSFEETQQLLKVTGYPILHGSIERDNFIIFAIRNKLSTIDINLELQKLGYNILE